ncbi:hypothetical protein [Pseudovibrio japonicus]|uniref:hypothetical protein n=1 Tax=Pseudovibrio japonicus TaxID=366534 RepID=UPI0016784312|nr:hypothetical protein [Pseudovibrio japonicus]
MLKSVRSSGLGMREVILFLAAINMILYFYYDVKNIGAGVFVIFWGSVYYLYTVKYKNVLWYIASCVSIIVIVTTHAIEILSKYNPIGLYEQFYTVYFATTFFVVCFFYAIRKKHLKGLPTEIFGPDRLVKQFLLIIPLFLGSPILLFQLFAPGFYEFVPPDHLTSSSAKGYFIIGDGSLPSSIIFASFLFYPLFAVLFFACLRNVSNYLQSK